MMNKKVIIGISIFLLFVCIASVSAEENVTQKNLLDFQDVENENVISDNGIDENLFSNDSEHVDVLEQNNDIKSENLQSESNETSNNHYGYWSFGRDMKALDLEDLSKKGVTDIFLNFYAYTLYNMTGVEEFIAEANDFGIHTHIWTQIFWLGEWVKPIDNGVINQEYFNEKIEELKYYAQTKGLSGIHYDYLRFSGSPDFAGSDEYDRAIDNPGGMEAISLFVKQANTAIHEINPNLIISAAVCPMPEHLVDWFGCNYSALTSSVDAVLPMLYIGSFYKDVSWVSENAKWFRENSKGADVWPGLQGYITDNNMNVVPIAQAKMEINAVLDQNATGAIFYRYGCSPNIDFTNLTVDKNELKSFSFLKYKIESAEYELNLSSDFVFDDKYDSAFVDGIPISRPITINGNGHVLDAKNLSRVFYINSTNVTLNNITFLNVNYHDDGGAVYVAGINNLSLNISNSIFSGNNSIFAADNDAKNSSVYLINNLELNNGGDYFILNKHNLYLCNNTLTNVIYNKGSISSYTNVTVMDNETFNIHSSTVELYAQIFDDNSNIIRDDSFAFLINSDNFNATFNSDRYMANYTLNNGHGKYIINSKSIKSLKNNTYYFAILNYAYNVSAPDLVKYYGNPKKFNVTVLDNDKAITNKSVYITINGVTYERLTDENGVASLNIRLNSGYYDVNVKVDELAINASVTIKSTVSGEDLTKIYRNDTQYSAVFYDNEGNPLKNTIVSFNVNGVFYNKLTDSNGIATLNINLPVGEYIITAINPDTGDMHSNNITVLSHFIEHGDFEKIYNTPAPYVIKICDGAGNVCVAGEIVLFNINGVFYNRTSDDNGNVALNINLMPGEYIITDCYMEELVSDKITVLAQ
ncbi:putative glycoside hydrolase [uncultured Methanobrevibacter sp.]|uniref:putative glycoside hydrolase n=1 Tax=uncultured Methanobrevibacter sp. TaxID=253161 RepID=UPI0025CF6C06|nr:putative glycoside hydrolase [uncultured Methanobrevibacter sp.]